MSYSSETKKDPRLLFSISELDKMSMGDTTSSTSQLPGHIPAIAETTFSGANVFSEFFFRLRLEMLQTMVSSFLQTENSYFFVFFGVDFRNELVYKIVSEVSSMSLFLFILSISSSLNVSEK